MDTSSNDAREILCSRHKYFPIGNINKITRIKQQRFNHALGPLVTILNNEMTRLATISAPALLTNSPLGSALLASFMTPVVARQIPA
jgi:hypothetical protein